MNFEFEASRRVAWKVLLVLLGTSKKVEGLFGLVMQTMKYCNVQLLRIIAEEVAVVVLAHLTSI